MQLGNYILYPLSVGVICLDAFTVKRFHNVRAHFSYVSGSSYILSCYFTNWGQYRPGAGKYFPTNIDPCLCDHLIYAFAGMDGNAIKTYEWDDVKLYGQFQALKNQLVHTHILNTV